MSKANQFKQQAEIKSLLANSYRGKANAETLEEYTKLAECYDSMAESYWRLYQKYLKKANEKKKKANRYTTKATSQVVDAIYDSIEADIGVGIGLGGTASVAEIIDVSAIYAADAIHLQLKDGNTRIGIKGNAKVGASLAFDSVNRFVDFGTFFQPFGVNPFIQDKEYEAEEPPEYVFGVSAEGYLFIGASAGIGINVHSLTNKLKEIF